MVINDTTKGQRKDLERAERGLLKGARQLNKEEHSEPENTEAVEQEAADGPSGRGLSR
jgi:hypothetical protein